MAPLSKHQKDFVKQLVLQILEEEGISSYKISDNLVDSTFTMYSDVVNSVATPSEKHAILISLIIRILLKNSDSLTQSTS